jgi:hypothetical protein
MMSKRRQRSISSVPRYGFIKVQHDVGKGRPDDLFRRAEGIRTRGPADGSERFGDFLLVTIEGVLSVQKRAHQLPFPSSWRAVPG